MNEKRQIKFNKLLGLYKDKLDEFIINNKLDDSPDYILNCILSADPDIIGKNSKWLINNTLNGNILWEDIEAGENSKSYDTLNRFLAIRKQFTDNKLKDINQFHRLGDIAQQLRGYEVIQSNKSIKNEEKQQIYSETEFLYNENGYLVISPKTERASCFWGLNTEWCTAATKSKNYFHDYNNDSPLYICILPNGEKYQFHNNSYPMDENDNPIDNIIDPVLKKLALITGQIDNIKKINYNNKNEAKLVCKYNGYAIKYIDKDLPFYEECCLLACKQNGNSIQFINKSLPFYEKCCFLAVQQNELTIKHIDKNLPYFEECCKLAIQQNGNAIHLLDKDLPYYEELLELSKQQIKEEVELPKEEINRDFSEIKEILMKMNTKIPIIKKDKKFALAQ